MRLSNEAPELNVGMTTSCQVAVAWPVVTRQKQLFSPIQALTLIYDRKLSDGFLLLLVFIAFHTTIIAVVLNVVRPIGSKDQQYNEKAMFLFQVYILYRYFLLCQPSEKRLVKFKGFCNDNNARTKVKYSIIFC